MDWLNFEIAEGWQFVEPRASAPDLIIEESGVMKHVTSAMELKATFGPVGPVDCPIAYDSRSRKAYRYVSEARHIRRDFSQIHQYNLDDGTVSTVLALPLNQWILWMLEWVPGSAEGMGRLYGLLASDRSNGDAFVLEHNLFSLDPAVSQARCLQRPLCRDAYYPIRFDHSRRLSVFSGAEGLYIVSIKGERLHRLHLKDNAIGRGASFCPNGTSRVLIGGSGLHLWDYQSGAYRLLRPQGQYPVWSPDGAGAWFSESSGDLMYFDFDTECTTTLLNMRKNHDREWSFARSPQLTNCSRYLAVPITGKQLKGVTGSRSQAGGRERIYAYESALCIFDLIEKRIWMRPGYTPNFKWCDYAE